MVQAAAACINNEESQRPNIDVIIAILRGIEPDYLNRKKANLTGNSCVFDCYPQLQQSKSEMKSHLALAMVGVTEFEDEDLYCRWIFELKDLIFNCFVFYLVYCSKGEILS